MSPVKVSFAAAARAFAPIVRGEPLVRTAFSDYPPLAAWWRMILALHGAPGSGDHGEAERIAIIARGFELYAWLYRGLGVFVLVIALGAAWRHAELGREVAEPLIAYGGLAGTHLWLASGLTLAGARAYRASPQAGAGTLTLGVVMLIAFICMTFVAGSLVAQALHLMPMWLNGALLGCALALGAGSYGIELAYLLAVPNHRAEPGKTASG
jgi:hypothetical protein